MISFFSKLGNKFATPRQKKNLLWGIFALVLFIILFLVSAMGSLRVFLPYAADLTGFPFGSRHYLIVFQNNHELRPGGGFISSYAIANFHYGFFTGLDVQDVYGNINNHPYMEPPYPMAKLLADAKYPGYTFRDANYQADYPKTAQELLRMLRITQPKSQIDGVIAVNYSFLEDLLGAVGSVTVDGKTFTKDTLFEMLEHEVNNVDLHNVEDLKNRKSILKTLASALIKKVALSPLKLRKVSDAIDHSLAAKEIQLYFEQPGLQTMVQSRGWSGQWPGKIQSDFLAVVEANLGGMKSDRYLKRNVTYHLAFQENQATGKFDPVAEVTVDLYHHGIDNVPLSGQYTGFFRTYVPRGAKLISAAQEYEKDLWQKDEGLYHIFGSIVRLEPGEKTRLTYRYSLPQTILAQNNYQLTIPKQSGTNQDYYTLIVEAPQGYGMRSSTFTPQENFALYQNEIHSDWELEATLVPDKTPPHLIYQAIDDMGKITLVFNEPLDNSTAEDPLNYQFEDLNVNGAQTTDNLTLDHIEHSGKTVILVVNGMTEQPEEHYSVTFKNLSDRHGNHIEPNPRTVTVVQRVGGN